MIKYRKIALLFLFLFVGFSACKKDNEAEVDDIPTVKYIEPVENHSYIVGDTVSIVFDVTSISAIKTIDISIVDANHIPVTANYSYTKLNGKSSGRVRFAIILEDLFLDAANYWVLVKVTNEKETKSKFQEIRITTYSKKLLGMSLITKVANNIHVWSYDQNLQLTLQKSMQGDFSGSAYIPFHNRMAIAAKVVGDFTIWDYLSGDTVRNFASSPNPPAPYFTGVGSVDRSIALLYYDEKFELYNYTGKLEYTVYATPNYYPVSVCSVGEYYISIQKNKNTPLYQLVTHLLNYGFPHSHMMLAGDFVAAFPYEGKDFMLFTNYSNHGHISKYIWQSNSTTAPISYNFEASIDAAQVDKDNYLILTDHDIFWYRYSTTSVTSIINYSFPNPICIEYDPIKSIIWVADKQGFSIYSFPDGTLIGSKRINEEVVDMHLIYNR